MRVQATAQLLRKTFGSSVVWLTGLGLVLCLRFPLNFIFYPPFLMDFEVFRTVATRILHGEALHLYEYTGTAPMMFKYAPCWALLLVPLGWLPGHATAVLWGLLGVVWLLMTCWLTERLCQTIGLRSLAWLSVAAVLLLARPMLEEFLQGQINLLWGCLVTATLFFEAREHWWFAAICLALAISLKLPALIFLPYLALRRRWSVLGRTALCLTLINVIAVFILLPSHPMLLFTSWLRVLATSGPERAFEIGNQSFLALLGRLMRPDRYGFNVVSLPDHAVFVIASLVQLVLFCTLFISPPQRRVSPAIRGVFEGGLLTVFMVLFSPTCWVATYAALLFPLLLALASLTSNWRVTIRSFALTTGTLALVMLSALTNAKLWRLLGIRTIQGETYIYLVVMILPWFGSALAWTLWHARRLATFLVHTGGEPARAHDDDNMRARCFQ